jgi:hypothetical protein
MKTIKMNHIKTYEGFLGLFKSKDEEKTVDTYDIVSCFLDLIDNVRITTSIRLDTNDNDISDYNFHDKFTVTLRDLDPSVRYKYLKKLEPNKYLFKFGYYSENIPNDEVKEILLDAESKLEIFDCKATFYVNLGYGNSEGEGFNYHLGDFNSVDKMYNKIAKNKYCQHDQYYGIIVEIESKYNIINREKYFGLGNFQ